MRFSSLFGPKKNQVQITPDQAADSLQITPDYSKSPAPESGPIWSNLDQSGPILTEIEFPFEQWCLPTQSAWATDFSPLKIMEKSRQVGVTRVDSLHSVIIASHKTARHDVFVSSRDEA